MKVIEIPVDDVIVNPELRTRKGGPSAEDVDRTAKSYLERHMMGQEPQIMPGVVRPLDGKTDKYELIDGETRLLGINAVNESGGLEGEPMLFRVQVARKGEDLDAIITGIQANFHSTPDVFQKADAMAKLVALGKSQRDVARIFNMHEATVSQMLKLNDVPKKYQKAVRDGDLEQDAAIFLGSIDDEKQRQDIFEEAIRHRQRYDEIMARSEHKQKKAEVDAEIEAAKERAEALKAEAKEAEKKARELDKAMSKSEDQKELEKLRKAKADADAEKKKLGKAWTDAEKAVTKAKEKKEKVAASAPTKKSKTSVEDVKEVAKSKGAKGVGPTPRTKNQFFVTLEAISENAKKPLPKSAQDLIGRIEGYLEGDYTEDQLANAFIKWCVPDAG